MKLGLLLLALLLFGCDFEADEAVRYLPIHPTELLYHKGDVLAFAVDSATIGAAIVAGYMREADDSTHVWYELAYTDYSAPTRPTLAQVKRQRLMGRRVASGIDPAGYFIGLDLQSVRNDCLLNNAAKFHLLGRLPLDTTTLKLGSQGASAEYAAFIQSFLSGKERRRLPPDHYDDYLSKQDAFRPDEYFALSSFLLE